MDTFLSTKCKRKYLELSNLQHGTFFIYLARSLIVTLNVDNPRVRVPKSLVFDACIFSEKNPVVVLSVFNSDDVSKRIEMYNTFVARGVPDALRTWIREDISITNSAVIIDGDLRAKVQILWEHSGLFHIQSSLKMWRDKAETAAIALLKSVSVASSFPLLYPDKVDSDDVWFLTPSEFQFLTNFIDLQGDNEEVSVEGDALLLQTEICLRLSKRYKTALLMTTGNTLPGKLQNQNWAFFASQRQFQDVISPNFELIITDVPLAKQTSIEQLVINIFMEVSNTDDKGYLETENKESLTDSDGIEEQVQSKSSGRPMVMQWCRLAKKKFLTWTNS